MHKLAPSPNHAYNNFPEVTSGKKLFITGIDVKFTYEEVNAELQKVLKTVEGVTGFRVKRKEGCPTYAFVDFIGKEESRQGL